MNAQSQIRTPFGDVCRKRDAVQAVKDRFYAQWLKISAGMAAEIARIEREGV